MVVMWPTAPVQQRHTSVISRECYRHAGCKCFRVLLTVSFWQGRENSAHFRTVNLDGLGVDQDECNYCRNRAFVDPCVNRAALDQDITGLQTHELIVFELAIKLTRQLNRVVHGFRAVCESHTSGSEFVNSERCAATVAHVIGVLNETGSLGGVSRRRVVDRHLISRPDLRTRDARSYPRNCCDLFVGLNNCFSGGIVTGYDASYLHCHCISPFCQLRRRHSVALRTFGPYELRVPC